MSHWLKYELQQNSRTLVTPLHLLVCQVSLRGPSAQGSGLRTSLGPQGPQTIKMMNLGYRYTSKLPRKCSGKLSVLAQRKQTANLTSSVSNELFALAMSSFPLSRVYHSSLFELCLQSPDQSFICGVLS